MSLGQRMAWSKCTCTTAHKLPVAASGWQWYTRATLRRAHLVLHELRSATAVHTAPEVKRRVCRADRAYPPSALLTCTARASLRYHNNVAVSGMNNAGPAPLKRKRITRAVRPPALCRHPRFAQIYLRDAAKLQPKLVRVPLKLCVRSGGRGNGCDPHATSCNLANLITL